MGSVNTGAGACGLSEGPLERQRLLPVRHGLLQVCERERLALLQGRFLSEGRTNERSAVEQQQHSWPGPTSSLTQQVPGEAEPPPGSQERPRPHSPSRARPRQLPFMKNRQVGRGLTFRSLGSFTSPSSRSSSWKRGYSS